MVWLDEKNNYIYQESIMRIAIFSAIMLSVLMAACGGSSGSSSKSSSSSFSLPSSSPSSVASSASSLSSSELSSSDSSVISSESSSSEPSAISSESSSSESSVISSESSSSESSSASSIALGCVAGDLYFCDDFAAGSDNWNLKPIAGANGEFSIIGEGDTAALRYTAAASGASGGVVALIKPEVFSAVSSADYYVEARIRPRLNASGTAQRSIYVMARYQDENNWYGMGMIAHETNQPRVEIVERNGTGNPASTGAMRHNTAITLGDIGADNGEWYTLRLVLIGSEMTLYLNGVEVASHSDTKLAERGLIGLFTNNRSFEVDDIRVGNPDDKPAAPAQLSINPASDYTAEVNDSARVIHVSAITPQNQADTFTVESSNPGVVSVTTSGNSVSLTPVARAVRLSPLPVVAMLS